MTFTSYAQNFEDVLLWRALNDVENGRYLDIGAQDPVIDSVSLAFYEAGWRGVHVEPTPAYAEKLRTARPDETVIQAAVSDAAGPIEFCEFLETGLSTGKLDIAERHESAGFKSRKITVPTISLQNLLDTEDGDFHWMKIDVEGMEPDVLRSWFESERRPWILVVEATTPLSKEESHEAWTNQVFKRGYREVQFDGLSRYFLHETQEQRAGALKAPANVFDSFVVSCGHFTAGAVRGELEQIERQAGEQNRRADELQNELTISQQSLEEARASVVDAQSSAAEARRQRDALREEERAALKALAEAEREHRQNIDGFVRERESALEQVSSLRTELATFTERADQLQERLEASEHRAAELMGAAAAAKRDHDQAVEEIAALRSVIIRADTLIRSAKQSSRGRWRQIGEALGLLRLRSAFSALEAWSLPTASFSHSLEIQRSTNIEPDLEPTMNNFAPLSGHNPYLRANSLAELLSWHDVNFVRCAYVTILGRQPDSEGEAYYTTRIRNGRPKLEIVRQLRRSPEGPQHDPGIAGLDRALKRFHNAQLPVIGWLIRRFTGEEGRSPVETRLRSISNSLGAMQDQLASLTIAIERQHRGLEEQGRSEVVSAEANSRVSLDLGTRRRLPPRAQSFFDRARSAN